jgi:hypothetical protein
VTLLSGTTTSANPWYARPVAARDGASRRLSVPARRQRYRLRGQSQDFWLLDLATGQRRQLTRLANQGAVRTFDIASDGRSIVFDRSRQNSNVVLIELPKQ